MQMEVLINLYYAHYMTSNKKPGFSSPIWK